MTDRATVEQLRLGDERAFSEAFRKYYPPVVAVVERMVRDRAVAEEVVQDVFLELWRRRATLVVEESLRGYLFRSARNRALNHLRHRRVVADAEPTLAHSTVPPASALTELEEREIDAAVRAAVDGLPDRCREVFELSRVHGLKYAEIAETLGISVKGVEAQMGKALRLLRERLRPWLPDPSPTEE